MRIYLPATSSDLIASQPPSGPAWTVNAAPGIGAEDLEVLEDDAQTEAALASLIRLRDEGGARRRIVLAADWDGHISAADDGVIEVAAAGLQWSDIVAILIDSSAAETAVEAVLVAEEQEDADAAVATLWDESLQWYDREERNALIADLGQ